MSATATLTQDQIGVVLRVTVTEDGAAKDISGASAKSILILQPSEAVLTKTATFTTDGTDGKFEFATVSGDLDEAGTYQWQGYVVVSGTEEIRSLRASFLVEEKIA